MSDKVREALEAIAWFERHGYTGEAGSVKRGYWGDIKAALAQQPESEPVAILCREIGETTWFDHTPLSSGSVTEQARKRSPEWDTCAVFAGPQPTPQVPEGLAAFLKRIGVMLQSNGSLNVWSSREKRWVIARMAGELSEEYSMLTATPLHSGEGERE